MKTLFVIFTLIGGNLVSPPIVLETAYSDCNTELATVAGINKHLKSIESPLSYKAVCIISLGE